MKLTLPLFFIIVACLCVLIFGEGPTLNKTDEEKGLQTATFGAGCFWCTEAVFERLEGVKGVVSGYEGGGVEKPSYEEVCSGRTGHAEVCQIRFDPRKISFEELLDVFWHMHDPTSLNKQGPDAGTQYRSAIFYHSEVQKEAAEASRQKANQSGKFDKPIVTEIVPSKGFYPAENYHQDYFRLNPNRPYCRFVIKPKLKKVERLKSKAE